VGELMKIKESQATIPLIGPVTHTLSQARRVLSGYVMRTFAIEVATVAILPVGDVRIPLASPLFDEGILPVVSSVYCG
jgi:hypothetical protein